VPTERQPRFDPGGPNRSQRLWRPHILRTGDKQLALELEQKGYDWLLKDAALKA
jgi:Fe-S cluster assembly ATPase SufC